MATKILDVDLAEGLPPEIPMGRYARLWAVGWRDGIPVGAALLEPHGRGIEGERVARTLATAAPPTEGPAPPPAPERWPSVSVVICTRNRPDRLPIALSALREQTLAGFEVVVVDNAPEDERTRTVVEALYPEAVYVVEPVPGLPRARNTGVAAASGEVLAFTDDDCRPIPRWLESCAREVAANERVGCVTGPILPLELETPAQEAMEARGGFNRGFARAVHTLEVQESPVHPVQAWRFGAGGSMAVSRACLEALGGFDEALWRSEDIDLFFRALRAGYDLVFTPGAAVRHRHLPTWGELRRRLFHWGWGYLAFLDKIARTDAEPYAERARLERRNWLRYQLRERLGPALHGGADLPLPLVLLELAGGVWGYRGYPAARSAAARRARPALGPSLRPATGAHG